MGSIVTRVLLVIALIQAVLAGGLAVTRAGQPEPDLEFQEDASDGPDGPALGDPGQAGLGAADTDPRQTFVPSPEGNGEPDSGSATAPGPLEIHGNYEQLKPEEQAYVVSGPPYEPIVEGRVADGSYWRVSAYLRPTGEICSEFKQWHPAKKAGGGGGGGCRSKDEWDFGLSSAGGRYIAAWGYAPVDAKEIELVAKDAGRGRVGAIFKSEMGVSFFVAWIECGGPDLDHLDALDSRGRAISTYSFKQFGEVGFPSSQCEAGS